MYLLCCYAEFNCIIEYCEKSVDDIEQFKKEFGVYYVCDDIEKSDVDILKSDVTIKLMKKAKANSNEKFEESTRVRIHSSHSRNIKYLLDGSIHTQKDALQHALLKEYNDKAEYFIEGSNTIVNVSVKNSYMEIIGDDIYNDLVYIYESLLGAFVETIGGIALHAASCSLNEKGIIICGESGAGKTTLLFDLINKLNAKFHSNDRLIVFNDPKKDKLTSYSIPIPVNVPIKTMRAMDKWKDRDVVKKAEDNTKIRFKVNEIPILFSNKLDYEIEVNYTILVKYNSSEPKVERISAEEILQEIELLTPYDECHPKWLPLFKKDLKEREVSDEFLKWLEKITILRISGNSHISALEEVMETFS